MLVAQHEQLTGQVFHDRRGDILTRDCDVALVGRGLQRWGDQAVQHWAVVAAGPLQVGQDAGAAGAADPGRRDGQGQVPRPRHFVSVGRWPQRVTV
jgi:hypothetical protein